MEVERRKGILQLRPGDPTLSAIFVDKIVDKNQVWYELMNRQRLFNLSELVTENKYNQIQPQNKVKILAFCELIDHWNDL